MSAEPNMPQLKPDLWPGATVGAYCNACGRPTPCAAHPSIGKAVRR